MGRTERSEDNSGENVRTNQSDTKTRWHRIPKTATEGDHNELPNRCQTVDGMPAPPVHHPLTTPFLLHPLQPTACDLTRISSRNSVLRACDPPSAEASHTAGKRPTAWQQPSGVAHTNETETKPNQGVSTLSAWSSVCQGREEGGLVCCLPLAFDH